MLERVATLLADAPFDWAMAGGWAVDMFAGRETRPHADCDIAVWREDQHRLRAHLPGGEWLYASGGHMQPWNEGEWLKLPVHEIHFLSEHVYEFLLNETVPGHWQYRRDSGILRPMEEAVMTRNGLKFLAPEIVLLYKSKNPSAEDLEDFETLQPLLSAGQKKWLRVSLRHCYSGSHDWLPLLG
jgi:hypothetical protein